ncbi:MAG: PAAR domain-containing protein [Polyangiaceae bacterium]
MSDSDLYAARQGDSVLHSQALNGLLAGLATGAAIVGGVALFAATGGFGIAALAPIAAMITIPGPPVTGMVVCAMAAAVASTGGSVGMSVASLSPMLTKAGELGSGSPDVLIGGSPAARAHMGNGDFADCDGPPFVLSALIPTRHGPKWIAQGSGTVQINGQPAARMRDKCECSAVIGEGCTTVLVGGCTQTTMQIQGEVPEVVQWGLLALGLGAGVVLGPLPAIAGLLGGLGGGYVGSAVASVVFPGSDDAQILLGFAGSMAGGYWGSKAGSQFVNSSTFRGFAAQNPRMAAFLGGGLRYLAVWDGLLGKFLNVTLPEQARQDGFHIPLDGEPGLFSTEGGLVEGRNQTTLLNETPLGQQAVAVEKQAGNYFPFEYMQLFWEEISLTFIDQGIVPWVQGQPNPSGVVIRAFIDPLAYRGPTSILGGTELPYLAALGIAYAFEYVAPATNAYPAPAQSGILPWPSRGARPARRHRLERVVPIDLSWRKTEWMGWVIYDPSPVRQPRQ